MPFELFIALRYLLARRRQAILSLISFISVLGVAVGVMALLIALALMTGLQGELRDRIVGSAAHVYVYKIRGMVDVDEEIKKFSAIPRVVGAAPAAFGKALIRSDKGDGFIEVKGIDPVREKTVTQLQNSIRKGSADGLARADDAVPGILIGTDLAEQLEVDIGDTVQVFSGQGDLTPFTTVWRPRPFQVAGIFSLGLYPYDAGYGFTRLDVARRLLGPEVPVYVELRVDDMFKAQEVVDAIVSRYGSEYIAEEWADRNRSLFSALWLEKMAISIAIGLIVMVAALQIVASLVLLVMEKSRDIAILKTMGCSTGSIRKIFMLQGLIIGIVGTAGGAAAGCALIYVLDRYKLISVPMDVYQISHVPFTLQLNDFLVVIAAAVVICFLATIYPSRQAARLDPAQALRYQ